MTPHLYFLVINSLTKRFSVKFFIVYTKHCASIMFSSLPVLLTNKYSMMSFNDLLETCNLSHANSLSSFPVDRPVFLSVFNKNSNAKQNRLSSLYLLRQSIFSCFFLLFFNSSNFLYSSNT